MTPQGANIWRATEKIHVQTLWGILDPVCHLRVKPNPGIYYERIPDIHYTETDWKIITYIKSLHYNAFYFTQNLQKLRNSCVHNQDYPDLYDSLVKRIYFIDAINKAIENLYNNLIDSMKEVEESETIPKASTVKRSAPFGFIGSISRTLFGTFNEKDGEYYNKKIDELFKGEKTLVKLAKEETHIVQYQLASVNKQLHEIKTSVNRSLEIYERKIVDMDDISDKWHHFEVNNRFTETANAI